MVRTASRRLPRGDASFWAGYLSELAHARIDWLDLFAVQSLEPGSERQVNALRYFATSPTFPQVGLPADKRARNVAMLSTIVQMAQARGIRVSVLSGRSDLDPCGNGDPGILCPLTSEADLETYTREAVQDLATEVPGLWRIGVRLGMEGGSEGAGFYARTYLAGLEAAGGPGFYMRTWQSNRSDVEMLATSPGGTGSLVEAKFSAEQVGPPYVPPNGNWYVPGASGPENGPKDWQPSYEYEDYLDGPEPFTFVFELWNSASYKYFRFAAESYARRALASMRALSPRVAGFHVQAAHALESQRDFWHANPSDVYSPWTYARDELEATLYGRIGYDPTTSDAALRAVLAARTGTDDFWDAEQAGSDIVAWTVTAHACGPDSRDFVPQLEWVGPVGYWASAPSEPTGGCAPAYADVTCANCYHGPLDPFDVASPYEAAHDLALGRATARISPIDVALAVDADVTTLRAAAQVSFDPTNAWARDVARECAALADLGDYFAHKLRGATALAVFEATAQIEWLVAARAETSTADDAWRELADDTSYFVPFTDDYKTYPVSQWSAQVPFLAEDGKSLDVAASAAVAQPPVFSGTLPVATTWLYAPRPSHPDAGLAVAPQDPHASQWTATVTVPGAPAGTTVTVFWKPFASTENWTPVAATFVGTTFTAVIAPTGNAGALFAAEVVEPGGASWRVPDPRVTMPYVSLAP